MNFSRKIEDRRVSDPRERRNDYTERGYRGRERDEGQVANHKPEGKKQADSRLVFNRRSSMYH